MIMIRRTVLFGLLALTSLLAGSTKVSLPVPAPAPEGCLKCPRSAESISELFDVTITFVPDAGTGNDGQCLQDSDPVCEHIPCRWQGDVRVRWDGLGTADVWIMGPGTDKNCAQLLSGTFCKKHFGVKAPQRLERRCPNGTQDVDIVVDGDPALIRFKCGPCE